MNYKQYCEAILLTEESQQEVFDRLKAAFPDQAEFNAYSSILNKFPSPAGKSMVVNALIRTRIERHQANVTPQQVKQIFDEFLQVQARGARIDLAKMTKDDRVNNPDEKDSQLFRAFTELIHQNAARIAAIDAAKLAKKSAVRIQKTEDEPTEDTKFPNAIYKDANVEVYQAKSPAQCAAYEASADSGICLKYPGHYWGTYRIPYQAAFYFIFPHSPHEHFVDIEDKRSRRKFLLVDYRLKGDAVWTYENNNMHHVPSLETIIQLFPFLKAPYDAGVFKKRPHEPEEVENYRKVESPVNDQTFLNFSPAVKDMYIANQHPLTDKQWMMLSKAQKAEAVNFSSNKDISDFQYEDIKKDNALIRRYIFIKKRGLENKINTGQFLRDGLTKHESAVLPDLMSSLTDVQKTTISKGLVKGMMEILTGQVKPKQDISGIYNLFKGQLLADPSMQTTETLSSIADILGGGKTASWKDLPSAVKKSVYGVAMDLFNANPTKMQNLIDDKIQRNISVLLQGLVDVPTEFQIKYFDKHKEELLQDKSFSDGLTASIEGHLVYGTEMTPWLKKYWQAYKKLYFADGEFMEKMKNDLQASLYSKDGSKYPDYKNMPVESKELFDILIDNIRKDPETMRIVEDTVYEMVLKNGKSMENINDWKTDSAGGTGVNEEFVKYYLEHAEQLKDWMTYKVIDTPPESIPPSLAPTIQARKDNVLENPVYKEKLEERLISDFVTKADTVFKWSGDRIKYWLKNFWDILSKHPEQVKIENGKEVKIPSLEKQLVNRVILEYGKDRTANPLYTGYGIPIEFYHKHEKEILSDPEAYRGLKQLIIEDLIWRNDPKATTEQVINSPEISAIQRDFYYKHKKEFPEEVVSVKNQGK